MKTKYFLASDQSGIIKQYYDKTNKIVREDLFYLDQHRLIMQKECYFYPLDNDNWKVIQKQEVALLAGFVF